MKSGTKILIGLMLIWNIILSLFLYGTNKQASRTENMVRNIYNKTTTISIEELNEPGSRWGFHGRDSVLEK